MNFSKTFEYGCAAFLLGAAAGSVGAVAPSAAAAMGALAFLSLLAGCVGSPRAARWLIAAAVVLSAGAAGALRSVQASAYDQTLKNFDGQKIELVGVIVEEPDARPSGQYVVVEFRPAGGNTATGRALVAAGRTPAFHFGETIAVSGKISVPGVIDLGGGSNFDYAAYLATDRIAALIERPKIRLLKPAPRSLAGLLFAVKESFLAALRRVVPEPEASFLAGILAGEKHGLSKEWLSRFQAAGLVHLVVLSGYNITIVAESVLAAFSRLAFLPRSAGLSFGALSVVLFALMVGGSATVIRASVMALIVILAKATGRLYGVRRALLVAAVVMVAEKPDSLLFDTSFELSFLATLALVYVSPLLEEFLPYLKAFPKMREILISTLSTQLTVLPLILYKIGTISAVAPVSNLVVLPLVPATMLAGFLASVAALGSAPLAAPFGFAAYALSRFELDAVHFFASIPFSSFAVKAPLAFLIGAYLFLFLAYQFLEKRLGAISPPQ